MVKKLLDSAVANATANTDVDVDTLFVKRIFADEGPTWKRFSPRAMGRATRIRKRSSHLTVVIWMSRENGGAAEPFYPSITG